MTRIRNGMFLRLAALALLGVLSAPVAVTGHALTADHELADSCELCLGFHRLADAIVVAEADLPRASVSLAPSAAEAAGLLSLPRPAPVARAPPSS